MAPDFEQQKWRVNRKKKKRIKQDKEKEETEEMQKENNREKEEAKKKGILLSMVPSVLHITSHFTNVEAEVPTKLTVKLLAGPGFIPNLIACDLDTGTHRAPGLVKTHR